MYDKLKDIFYNVNEWLRFAEAKHAGLSVLNSGIVFGILSIYKDYKCYLPHWLLAVIFLFLGFSMLIIFSSLFPRTFGDTEKHNKPKNPNFFFAGDLCQFSSAELQDELRKHINVEHNFNGIERDIISQIVVNSKIATRKFNLFRIAVAVTAVGLTVPFLFIIFTILTN